MRWGLCLAFVFATACEDQGRSSSEPSEIGVTIEVDKQVAIADGADVITFTLMAAEKVAPSIPVAGIDVVLFVSGTGNTLGTAILTTDEEGNATTTLRSTKAEAKTITAVLV